MHNAMIETMKTDALNDLFSGYVTPLDREILADMPLPSDMVDPFASQDVAPLAVMNLTYVSLSGWIADARKEKYYSERFVSLSKLVMKGVTIMGRGLVTLHQRGEDLSAAPMQIDDLISVGSYHFRKSYLGVVQFSARHPEIGERLLVNQLGWSTTLLRLYKTKEKLDKKSETTGNKKSEIRNMKNEEIRLKNEEASKKDEGILTTELRSPAAGSDSSFLPLHSSSDDRSALDSVSALFEPAAFSAQRALTSLSGNRKSETTGNQKSEIRNKKNEEERKAARENLSDRFCKEQASPDSDSETEALPAAEPASATHVRPEAAESSSETRHTENEENSVDGDLLLITDIPETVKIMQNVMMRSKGNEDGMLTFTIDEMRVLAADPIFAEMEPELTADIRNALARFDSG